MVWCVEYLGEFFCCCVVSEDVCFILGIDEYFVVCNVYVEGGVCLFIGVDVDVGEFFLGFFVSICVVSLKFSDVCLGND